MAKQLAETRILYTLTSLRLNWATVTLKPSLLSTLLPSGDGLDHLSRLLATYINSPLLVSSL